MEFPWHNPPFNITPYLTFPGESSKAIIGLDAACKNSVVVVHLVEDGETHFKMSATDFIKIIKMTPLYIGEVCCPHCSQNKFVKYGKSYKGKQRYLCRSAECRARVFTINSHQLT